MSDKFEEMLKGLSILLDTKFHIDKNRACSIIFDEKIILQLELDENLENLIVFSSVCPLAPGKFRENVFLEALKENNKFPYIAIFAYYEADNSLAMCNYLPFDTLNPEILSSYLSTFIDLAFLYQEAISRGQTSPILKPT